MRLGWLFPLVLPLAVGAVQQHLLLVLVLPVAAGALKHSLQSPAVFASTHPAPDTARPPLPRTPLYRMASLAPDGAERTVPLDNTPFEGDFTTLFVELGFGNDQHGQTPTKAAVRACRNAIEFNSIPSIRQIVPGGYDNMKLKIKLACPDAHEIDRHAVAAVFPYGNIVELLLEEGGMRCSSGIVLEAMGDRNDSMVVCNAAVYVGY